MLSAERIKKLSRLKLKKYREQENSFLIEGTHLIEECLSSTITIKKIIYRKDLSKTGLQDIIRKAESQSVSVDYTDESGIKKLTDTQNSQGIIAVVEKPAYTDLNKLLKPGVVLMLDRINDPGNMGTIIRTAYWFGVNGVLISKDSVDIYNSKVIRSTQGAIFHIPVLEERELESDIELIFKTGFEIYITHLKADKDLEDIKFTDKSAVIFGSESTGVRDSIIRDNHKLFKIKSLSDCESLNVAVSTGIVLHKITSK